MHSCAEDHVDLNDSEILGLQHYNEDLFAPIP